MSSIKGLDSLMRKIDAVGGNSKKALKEGVLQAAKKVQGDAKDLCPADTGELRNSIQARVEDRDGKAVGLIATNVEYAPYVEFGTGQKGEASQSPPKYDGDLSYRQDWAGMRAQPFMYPAAAQNKVHVPEIIAASLRKELRRLGGR